MFNKLPFTQPTSIKYETKPMQVAPYGDYLHDENGTLHLPPLDAWAGSDSMQRVPIMGAQLFSQIKGGIHPVVATHILRSTASLVTHVCRETYFSNKCDRLEFRKVVCEMDLKTQEIIVGVKSIMVCDMGSKTIELLYRWSKYDFHAETLRSPRSVEMTVDHDQSKYHLQLNPYQGMGSQHMPLENELSGYHIVFDGGAKKSIHLTTGSEEAFHGVFSSDHIAEICHSMFGYILGAEECQWVYPWIDEVVLDVKKDLPNKQYKFSMYAHMPNYHGEYGWIETGLCIDEHAHEQFNHFGKSTLPMCFGWTPQSYNKALGHAKNYGMGEKMQEHYFADSHVMPQDESEYFMTHIKGEPMMKKAMDATGALKDVGKAMGSLGDAFEKAGESMKGKKQPNTQADLEIGCSIEDAIARARKKAKEAKEAQANKLQHKPSATAIGKFFKAKCKKHFNATVTVNPKAFGQIKVLMNRLGENRIYRVLENALDNWDEFLQYVEQERNWKPDCKTPNMGILLHLADELKEFYYMKSGDKDVDAGDTAYNTAEETKQSNQEAINNIWK